MKNKYYNENGNLVQITENRYQNKKGQTVLNIAALNAKELANSCGLYTYQPPSAKNLLSANKRVGKILIDPKTGTATREIVDLTAHEIEQQEEEKMFLEYEAEQAANLEIEKSQKFASWKATKKDKATKNNIKNKN